MAWQIFKSSVKNYFGNFGYYVPFGIIYASITVLPMLFPYIGWVDNVTSYATVIFAEIPLYFVFYKLLYKKSMLQCAKENIISLILYIIINYALISCISLLEAVGIPFPYPWTFFIVSFFMGLLLISIIKSDFEIKNGFKNFFGLFSKGALKKMWLMLKILIIEHFFLVITVTLLGLLFMFLPTSQTTEKVFLLGTAFVLSFLFPYDIIRTWLCYEVIASDYNPR